MTAVLSAVHAVLMANQKLFSLPDTSNLFVIIVYSLKRLQPS
jgi:hypothetical protein